MTSSTWAILIASGKDEMLNADTCTAFLNLKNKPILSYSLTAFEHCPEIDNVIVVAPRERLEQVVSIIQLFGCHKVRKVVPGAANEYASFVAAMKFVDEDFSLLVVHEASRPGIRSGEISGIVKVAKRQGLVMAGQVIRESAVIVDKAGNVEEHPVDGTVWTYGTPLAIKADALEKMQSALRRKKKTVKTLLEGLEGAGQKFRLVSVTHFPVKIDTPDHLREMELASLPV